jgi:pSer/pThr/pTyr-binding forkhead associated (FHA) protein
MPAAVDNNPTSVRVTTTGEPFLQIKLKGKSVGRRVLNQPRITLGRSPQSDIVLDSTGGVSRNHAHILIIDGEVLIEDLSSRNGTFVNGRVCKRRTLKRGDRISIGRYKLRFRHAPNATLSKPNSQARLAALMRMWSAAAVTTRIEHCLECGCDMTAHAIGPDVGARTDELPRLIANETAAVEDRTDPHLQPHDRPGEIAPNWALAVPTGVAITGDTVNDMAIPFFN